MSLVIVITRNLPDRFEGLFVGQMLKVAPGVYIAPRMSARVRDKLWAIVNDWSDMIPAEDGGVVMIWPRKDAPSGLEFHMVGWPPKTLVEYEGLWLVVEKICVHHRFHAEDHLPDRNLFAIQASHDPLPDLCEDPQLSLDELLVPHQKL